MEGGTSTAYQNSVSVSTFLADLDMMTKTINAVACGKKWADKRSNVNVIINIWEI
jgi:hypothetical protein